MNHYQALQLAHRWLVAARTADKIGGDELAEDMAKIEGAMYMHPDQIPDGKPIPYDDLFAKFIRVRGQYIQEINMTSLLAQAIRDMLAVPKEGTDIGEPIERARNLAEASKTGRASPTLLDEAVDGLLAAAAQGSFDEGDAGPWLEKLEQARTGAPTLLPARDSLWAATAAINFLVAVVDECGKQVMLDLGTCRKIQTARELAQQLETA